MAAVSLDSVAAPLVRSGGPVDLPAVSEIYAAHVLRGTGTFDELPPDLEEMTARYDASRAKNMPFLVVDVDGRIGGFAYASYLRPRSAYRFTVEDSVYVHPQLIGRGLGRRLLSALITECEALGYRQMIAVIGDSANDRSIGLHAALGFSNAGTLSAVGFKFGRWLDVVFMQRQLGEGDGSLPRA